MAMRLDAVQTASHLSAEQLGSLRGFLTEERTAQQARAAELQDPIDLEPDLAEVLLERSQESIEEIDAALARMDAGSYGTCVVCESAIPYERLEIMPAADRCVVCQADRDRLHR